jgi:hypothetical protein
MGWMHRRGRLELILVLADGGHLMVPAAWTDLRAPIGRPVTGTLASLDDLLAARRVLEPLLERAVLAGRDDPASEDPRNAAASGNWPRARRPRRRCGSWSARSSVRA